MCTVKFLVEHALKQHKSAVHGKKLHTSKEYNSNIHLNVECGPKVFISGALLKEHLINRENEALTFGRK